MSLGRPSLKSINQSASPLNSFLETKSQNRFRERGGCLPLAPSSSSSSFTPAGLRPPDQAPGWALCPGGPPEAWPGRRCPRPTQVGTGAGGRPRLPGVEEEPAWGCPPGSWRAAPLTSGAGRCAAPRPVPAAGESWRLAAGRSRSLPAHPPPARCGAARVPCSRCSSRSSRCRRPPPG